MKGYNLPFDYSTGIKPVRSGLLRGSSGTGHNRATVTHLIVKEAFEEGRLSREANTFLCDPNSSSVTVHDGEHDEPREVTCSSCLDYMERWAVCPLCGKPYNGRQVHGPNEGPNKSSEPVELFFHDGQVFCSREVAG